MGVDSYKFSTSDGPVSVVIKPVGDKLVVEWVGKPRGAVSDRMNPGTPAVREILQNVVERYPEARTLRYERVSGSRMGKAADKSKDLWVERTIRGGKR